LPGRPGETGDAQPAAAGGAAGGQRTRIMRELVALGCIWAAIVATYLLGFEIGVPLVAAAYSLTSVEWNRRWQRFAYAAIVTGAAYGISDLFLSLFHLTFSGSLI
ncbi:MAG TPA: hypothetical protein VHV09_02815, partial [Trebonia sp.]|nr:hypothetical protein [Trebonia sp.]